MAGLLQPQLLRSRRFLVRALGASAQGSPARCKISQSVPGAMDAPFPVDTIVELTAGAPSSLAACCESKTCDTRCARPRAPAGAAPGSVAISRSAPSGRSCVSTPARRCGQSHDPATTRSPVSPSPAPGRLSRSKPSRRRTPRVRLPSCSEEQALSAAMATKFDCDAACRIAVRRSLDICLGSSHKAHS